jgi:hypothetical protein
MSSRARPSRRGELIPSAIIGAEQCASPSARARASVVPASCFFFSDRQARMSRRNPSVVEGRLAFTQTAGEISRARVGHLLYRMQYRIFLKRRRGGQGERKVAKMQCVLWVFLAFAFISASNYPRLRNETSDDRRLNFTLPVRHKAG